MSTNATKQTQFHRIKSLEEHVKAQKTRIRALKQVQTKLNQALKSRFVPNDSIEQAHIYFVSMDISGHINFTTPNIETLMGVASDQLIGRSLNEFIHAEDIATVALCWHKSIQHGRQIIEHRIGSAGGDYRWVMAIVVPQLSGGRCDTLQTTLIDIDGHRRTPKESGDEEAKYQKIIESIHEGYFETDLEGRISFCNQALLRMSGYKRGELIGKTFKDVVSPRTAHVMQSIFGKVYKTGKEANVSNYEVFHKSGRTLIIEFAAGLRVDQRGKPIGFHGVLRDVSTQVKAMQKQKQLQLQRNQVQKMDALGTLAGGLAHGFNNVLMAIQGNLSLIRMNLSAQHPMQKHLERINQSTEKGSQLAREILSFAKIGKFVVMPTNLNKILKSTSRMFVRANSTLKIHELYQDDLWQSYVDRVQIGQVLLSLFMNAAEAMPEGGDLYLQSENVTLDESYTNPFDAKPGRHVKISVTDCGPGLDEDAKQRIFEPFFTAYRPLRYDGLGLAASYGTVKSHDGIINVYSEKGHGTTFTIYLPAAVSELAPPTDDTERIKGSETILLVDDDEIAARIGREILESYGYRIMVASCGQEAIEVYHAYQNQIHLVLLDVILPDINGEQVYMELKRRNPDVLVVLASGYNVNKHIQALLRMGCIDFLQKPFQSELLSERIRAALDKEGPPPEIEQLTR